jgi:phage terminase large subunit-like protein
VLPDGRPYPTAGPIAGRWIQRSLVHGEGDHLGERIRLLLFQWFILNRIYEFDPDTGRLVHDTVLIVISKGNGKTELCGDLANVEMQSPLAPLRSPKVTISASSWKQADELLQAAQLAIIGSDDSPGPLAGRFQKGLHLLDDKILAPNGGRLLRLAAVGSTADGGKETCHLGDELHEWLTERSMRMWTVKGRSIRKRVVIRGICARCLEELVAQRGRPPAHRDRAIDRDHAALPIRGGLQIGITTVGNDPTVVTEDPATLLGRLWRKGVAIAKGEVVDPTFLFLAWQAEEGLDLDNPDDLTQAILQASPAAAEQPGTGGFLSVEEKRRSILDTTVSRVESERYDLGWWSSAPNSWMPLTNWLALRHPEGLKAPPRGTPIWIGFDGSKSRDSTAMWGITEDGHLFRLAVWERPPNAPAGWQVSHIDVDREVVDAFAFYGVKQFAMDPPRWEVEYETWSEAWPGRVVAFDTAVYERFALAVGRFTDAVLSEAPTVTHDGDQVLTRHIANARRKEVRWGFVITKEDKDSPRRIDAAVAAVLAHDAMTSPEPEEDRTVQSWSPTTSTRRR